MLPPRAVVAACACADLDQVLPLCSPGSQTRLHSTGEAPSLGIRRLSNFAGSVRSDLLYLAWHFSRS